MTITRTVQSTTHSRIPAAAISLALLNYAMRPLLLSAAVCRTVVLHNSARSNAQLAGHIECQRQLLSIHCMASCKAKSSASVSVAKTLSSRAWCLGIAVKSFILF